MNKYINCALAMFLLIGCGERNSAKDNQNSSDISTDKSDIFIPYNIGDKIKLKSVTGSKITLLRTENGFKIDGSDKIILIDIFGTYCQPCRTEAPSLMDFQLKYSDNLSLIGLIYREDITNDEIVENFSKRYNAYYFISNSKENERIVRQILNDIDYAYEIAIPFKVIIKDGIYQTLTNTVNDNQNGTKFYIGRVDINILYRDFEKIIK